MIAQIDDLLLVDGIKYIVLAETRKEGNQYYFVNEVTDDEEVTTDFYVMKEKGKNLVIEENKDILKKLLPYFTRVLQQKVEKFKTKQKDDIS